MNNIKFVGTIFVLISLTGAALPVVAQESAQRNAESTVPLLAPPTKPSITSSAAPSMGPVSQTWVQTCSLNQPSTLEGYRLLDHQVLIDMPDQIMSRATAPFEEGFTIKLIKGDISGPLTKSYCQIGVTRMVVDITYAVQDDSIAYVSTRAVYKWVAEADMIGWQIAELGEKFVCARGQRKLPGSVCI